MITFLDSFLIFKKVSGLLFLDFMTILVRVARGVDFLGEGLIVPWLPS